MSDELLPDAEGRDDTRLLAFMNQIPPLDEPIAWANGFRSALVELFDDVDRVSITVNLESYDLEHSVRYGHINGTRVTPLVLNRIGTTNPADLLAIAAADTGFPIKDYHSPSVITFSAGEKAYLGAIVLWRLRSRTPVSERTLTLLNELRPFITYRLFECVARMVRDERIDKCIRPMAETIGARVGLTEEQKEVFAMAAGGLSTGAMATRLGVLPASVRRAVSGVYKRTGTADVGEIFRRFVGRSND